MRMVKFIVIGKNINGTLMHSAEYFFGQKNGYEKWYYKKVLKSEAIFEYGSSFRCIVLG